MAAEQGTFRLIERLTMTEAFYSKPQEMFSRIVAQMDHLHIFALLNFLALNWESRGRASAPPELNRNTDL